MERDTLTFRHLVLLGNFNSHAHVERDAAEIALDYINIISTHTLTWSVTYYGVFIRHTPCISTHTLTWSVTIDLNAAKAICKISTHTLTWSVTIK